MNVSIARGHSIFTFCYSASFFLLWPFFLRLPAFKHKLRYTTKHYWMNGSTPINNLSNIIWNIRKHTERKPWIHNEWRIKCNCITWCGALVDNAGPHFFRVYSLWRLPLLLFIHHLNIQTHLTYVCKCVCTSTWGYSLAYTICTTNTHNALTFTCIPKGWSVKI